MESPTHTLNTLFDQLGLESSDQAIFEFQAKHRPLARELELHQAHFWSPAQSALLIEMKESDADWAELVDQLDASLR